MVDQDRLDAFHLLVACIDEDQPLAAGFHKKKYSSFTKALCFGVTRHYFRLATILEKLLTKPPKSTVVIILMMGLFELVYLGKPDYAVVNEYLKLVDTIKHSWAKGLVNAVLRRFCREKSALLASVENDPEFSYGLPLWLLTAIQTDWPDNWLSIAQAYDAHPPLTLRVNQQHLSRDAYLNQLKELNIDAEPTVYSEDGVVLLDPLSVLDIPGFFQGDVSVQDEGAQLVLPLCVIPENGRVLDACCAPGGKTGHLFEKYSKSLNCVALDNDDRRLARVKENMTRLHFHPELICMDATRPDLWWNKKQFDVILIDAPCSATGVLRRQPDIRIHRTSRDVETAVHLQEKILNALWPLLKEGGRFIYVTCSVLKVENDGQIESFLARHNDALISPIHLETGMLTKFGWQLFPTQKEHDGFYFSVIEKQK